MDVFSGFLLKNSEFSGFYFSKRMFLVAFLKKNSGICNLYFTKRTFLVALLNFLEQNQAIFVGFNL
jgi:hypothetical protein